MFGLTGKSACSFLLISSSLMDLNFMIPLMTPKFLSMAGTSSLGFLLEISSWISSIDLKLYMSKTSKSDSHPPSNLKPDLSTYFPGSVNGNSILQLWRPKSLESLLTFLFLSHSPFDLTAILLSLPATDFNHNSDFNYFLAPPPLPPSSSHQPLWSPLFG